MGDDGKKARERISEAADRIAERDEDKSAEYPSEKKAEAIRKTTAD